MFLEVKLFYKRKIISFAESEKKYDFVGGLGGGGWGWFSSRQFLRDDLAPLSQSFKEFDDQSSN